MPELPEVEVVRVGLAPAVTGAIVTGATVFDERSLRRHDGPSEDFVDRLVGRSFLAPERRGKFLWVPLALASPKLKEKPADAARNVVSAAVSTDPPSFSGQAFSERVFSGQVPPEQALVVHLGMSGQVLLREPAAALDRLTRIRIDIDHPRHGTLRIDFVDQRIFGSMAIDDLVATPDVPGQRIPGQVAHIARDPLDPDFDDDRFLAALARRNTGVKRALLDQSLISGIGNIYADEALWAARVHYDQPTSTLGRARARALLAEVRLVLGRALAEGGTSFDAQYVNVNGASGYFSHSLNAYGRQGESCPRCGRPLVREQFMNRGSHFCPWCQRVR